MTILHCRLNGTAGPGSERYLPEGLPLPLSTRQERQAAVHELTVQLDQLEKQLQESSKVRSAAVLAWWAGHGVELPGPGCLATPRLEPALWDQSAVPNASAQAMRASAK